MDGLTYLKKMNRVEGWLDKSSAKLIYKLCKSQRVGGAVCEIGVHHGKLFILLALMSERSIAIDIFDSALNIDGSGAGDLKKFKENLRWAGLKEAGDNVTIIKASSETVTPDDIGEPIRFFSVDGGHTADLTEGDLRLALEVLVKGGIVVLDDYFNPGWPDVSVGANRLMDRLIPFAVSPNKTFFTNDDAAAEYYRSLIGAPEKTMNGYAVAISLGPTADWIRKKGWHRGLPPSVQRMGKWLLG